MRKSLFGTLSRDCVFGARPLGFCGFVDSVNGSVVIQKLFESPKQPSPLKSSLGNQIRQNVPLERQSFVIPASLEESYASANSFVDKLNEVIDSSSSISSESLNSDSAVVSNSPVESAN